MIGFIFNYDVFDEPYNQTQVKKGCAKLGSYLESLNQKAFFTYGKTRCFGEFDMSDDYVIVQHTAELTGEQKQYLAQCIKEITTVKKTVYKKETPKLLVVFEKKEQEDCFTFNA